MDRRQQRTRRAIFDAFGSLLASKSYSTITVKDIIDKADIGRTTFYAHFETKDELLKELCTELFKHIIDSAADCSHTHGLYSNDDAPKSVFCHLLQHLQKNDNNILGLLSCESNGIFFNYFRESLNKLIGKIFTDKQLNKNNNRDFIINHISGSFVEMVIWWIDGGLKLSAEELDELFRSVIEPII